MKNILIECLKDIGNGLNTREAVVDGQGKLIEVCVWINSKVRNRIDMVEPWADFGPWREVDRDFAESYSVATDPGTTANSPLLDQQVTAFGHIAVQDAYSLKAIERHILS